MKYFNLNSLVRSNIQKLEAYSSARNEFKGKAEVYLDANESPFGVLNRYPDPKQIKVKERLAIVKKLKINQIFIGNGSDEAIDIALRIFCEPGKDKALSFYPTYSMYKVSAAINNVELVEIALTSDFQIDVKALKNIIANNNIKLIFICSPNNPTGNCFDPTSVLYILNNFKGIVFIDEAYIDFSTSKSYIAKINEHPNLIVSQTFSKAWGLAGARIGTAFANSDIIKMFNKVKAPYNISTLNQEAVLSKLDKLHEFEKEKDYLISEKIKMSLNLKKVKAVKKIHPSQANFILVEISNAQQVYNYLISKKIVVRKSPVKNCLRLGIGKKTENKKLLKALQQINAK
ncbi:MAG: histidinol-phosphate transaminase [Tenacibaculum sp.]